MRRSDQLERLISSLPDIEFRVGWLREQIVQWPTEGAAHLLDAVCEDGERAEHRAKEAMLAIAIVFAGLGECDVTERLREEAVGRRLLSLGRLLRRGPAPVMIDRPAHEQPVPDYGAGRDLTVGERRSLARRPNRRSFEKLLLDPHPLVIAQLLQNPRMTEDDVVRMGARRPARSEVIEAIAKMPRWLSRARVRMTLLLNPGTPSTIAMPLLGACTRQELREIASSADSAAVLRVTANELLQRRPPLGWDAAERSLSN